MIYDNKYFIDFDFVCALGWPDAIVLSQLIDAQNCFNHFLAERGYRNTDLVPITLRQLADLTQLPIKQVAISMSRLKKYNWIIYDYYQIFGKFKKCFTINWLTISRNLQEIKRSVF